jgi:dolichol-phosphate mannosyltransferase
MPFPFTSASQLDRLLPVPNGDLIVPHHPSTVYFSLVVPTYQEGQNIENLVARLTQLLDQLLPHDYELLIIDDDSPDCTWEIALALTDRYPQLRVMRRQQERGLATAVIRGWQISKGAVLGVIDGDLQHPPEVLAQLLAAIRQGSDLAVASRAVEGGGVSDWSLKRRILSRGAQLLGLVVLPQVMGRVSDPMSGYFLVKRGSIAAQRLNPKGYKILIEVVGRGDIAQISEVGYVFRERQEGESKVTWRQYRDYLHHLLRLRLSTGRVGRIRRAFPWGRFVRFGLVGLSGLGVDMGMLHFAYGMLGLGLTRSAVFAGELAILNNFLWNDVWTFRDLSQRQRGMRPRMKRLLKFNIVCLMGLILKVMLLNLLYNGLHLNAYAANLLAIAAVTVWNFWINLKLSWRVTEVEVD